MQRYFWGIDEYGNGLLVIHFAIKTKLRYFLHNRLVTKKWYLSIEYNMNLFISFHLKHQAYHRQNDRHNTNTNTSCRTAVSSGSCAFGRRTIVTYGHITGRTTGRRWSSCSIAGCIAGSEAGSIGSCVVGWSGCWWWVCTTVRFHRFSRNPTRIVCSGKLVSTNSWGIGRTRRDVLVFDFKVKFWWSFCLPRRTVKVGFGLVSSTSTNELGCWFRIIVVVGWVLSFSIDRSDIKNAL